MCERQRTRTQAMEHGAEHSAEHNRQDGPMYILFVDDEPDLKPLIKQLLRQKIRKGEYVFGFAENGCEALAEMEREERYEMVVTDINMPHMDGLELLKNLAVMKPDVKAIVVSAYGDMANIRSAMNRGAFDFVTKPVDFEDLTITIERTRQHIEQWSEARRSQETLAEIQNEMRLASRMQQAILPNKFPHDERFSVHASMSPAREVGGDFYDVMELESGRIGASVADVSGKGIPAALFMMTTRTVLKGSTIGHRAPSRILDETNRILVQDNPTMMFVTIIHANYDPDNGEAVIANGGHCDPIVVQGNGQTRFVERAAGALMGMSEGLEFEEIALILETGDTLILYSDGVTEATDPQGNEYGDERLLALFDETGAPLSAHEATARVHEAVTKFTAGAEQSDDLTCLAIHRCK